MSALWTSREIAAATGTHALRAGRASGGTAVAITIGAGVRAAGSIAASAVKPELIASLMRRLQPSS